MSIIRLKSDRILMACSGNIIDRVQSLGNSTDFPSEDIKELGNPLVVSVIKDVPSITVDAEAFDANCELITVLQGGNPKAATPPTVFDITAEAFKKVHFIFPVKQVVGTNALKTGVISASQVTGLNYRYAVDGTATESLSFLANNKHWVYQSAAYEGFVGNGTTKVFNLATATYGGARNFGTNKNIICVMVDGLVNYEGSEAEVIAGTKDFFYTALTDSITFGTAPANNAKIDVTYPCLTVLSYPQSVHEGEDIYPGGIKGKNIPVLINAGKIDRVQSVNITVSFPTIDILEMGNVNKVATEVDIPEVTGDISVLDRDGDIFAKMCNKAGLNATYPVLGVSDLGSVELEIKLLDPSDNSTILKTIYLPAVEIVGEGHTSRVGENLTQTFNFKLTANTKATIYRGAR